MGTDQLPPPAWNAPSRHMNSETNPLRPGRPTEAIEKERLDREAKARRAKLEKATPTFKLEAPVGPDRKPRSKS